jgi:hypothetical protein
MEQTTPHEFWTKFGDFNKTIYLRVAGDCNTNAKIESYNLETLLKFQTINQPRIITYEENPVEVWILSIDIEK